jgi:hypothetical protein
MRYRAPTTLLLLVTLAACRGEPEQEPSKCDLDALTELGHTLAPLSFAEQAERVWPGIMAACDDEVPTPLVNYFDPETLGDVLPRGRGPWTIALQRRACARWDAIVRAKQDTPLDSRALEIFEACDFGRYEVLTADEIIGTPTPIMTWATHQWLLDQGLDARAAAPLTRALFARNQIEFWWLIEIEDDLRAPKAHGVPFPGGMSICVTREQVIFAGRQDFATEDGRLMSPWFGEHMVEEAERTLARADRGESDAVLLIVGDARAEMTVVTAVLYAGKGAGFERFGLFVAPEAFVPTHIPVALAPHDPADAVELDPKQTPMLMSVELTPDGLTLGRGWNDRSKLQAHALDDLAAVASFAEATRRADPNARVVVISAERAVTLDQTLAVIEAARGPQCSDNEADCVLPDVLLRSQGAHRYPKRLD